MRFFVGEPILLTLLPAIYLVLMLFGLSKRFRVYPFILLCILGLLRPYIGYLPDDWNAEAADRKTSEPMPVSGDSASRKPVIARLHSNTLHVGDSLVIDVQVSAVDKRAVAVFLGDRRVHEETVTPSKTGWFRRIRTRVKNPGLTNLSLTCLGVEDEFRVSLPVLVIEKSKVLVVAHDRREAETLVSSLEHDDIQVNVEPPSDFPDDSSRLEQFGCILIYDVPNVFEQSQLQSLADFVDGGGGLVVIAGPKLFSVGAYAGSEFARLLPVTPDIPKQIEKYEIALGLIMDTSGSMAEADGGFRKIDLAREAALASAFELQEGKDKIGILAFAGKADWIAELADLDESSLPAKLAQLQPGGETDLMSGLIKMRLAMEASSARIRHVLVLSDGLTAGKASDFQAIARRFASSGVTLSAISLGSGGNDHLLNMLAREGGGQFYNIGRASELVKVFTQDTRMHTRSGLIEQPVKVAIGRPPAWADGISFENLPPLLGMVASAPKKNSVVHIKAENGLPLLSSCRRGLGQVFLFSSDAGDRYARLWVDGWPDFGPFWAQLVRYASKGTTADYRPEYVSTSWGRGILIRNVPQDARPPSFVSISDAEKNQVGVCNVVHTLLDGSLWAPLRRDLEEGNYVCSIGEASPRPLKVARSETEYQEMTHVREQPVWPLPPYRVIELAPLCFMLAAAAYVLERVSSK
ncbi:MAG: VWA domain-containing protein [Planctomycetota bacterium]|nr:VWA domain-containing protein [Planctomycetota bacterium]MDA1137953.1 VWA domain-containing protein [Planctomycetota bacterium]